MADQSTLREWGFDIELFETKAKQALLDLQKSREPVAAELKKGFERAWQEIEQALARAREAMRNVRQERQQATRV